VVKTCDVFSDPYINTKIEDYKKNPCPNLVYPMINYYGENRDNNIEIVALNILLQALNSADCIQEHAPNQNSNNRI
jgi:hypothetical protein